MDGLLGPHGQTDGQRLEEAKVPGLLISYDIRRINGGWTSY